MDEEVWRDEPNSDLDINQMLGGDDDDDGGMG